VQASVVAHTAPDAGASGASADGSQAAPDALRDARAAPADEVAPENDSSRDEEGGPVDDDQRPGEQNADDFHERLATRVAAAVDVEAHVQRGGVVVVPVVNVDSA